MKKIEVLRSDRSMRRNLQAAMETASEHILPDNSIHTMKISSLLQKTGISNTELAEYVEESASDDPLIGSRQTDLAEPTVASIPDDREVYTFEYSNSIKNNLPLENHYTDEIRGNVIRIGSHDSTYVREFDYNDHMEILSSGQFSIPNTRNQYKKFFLITNALNCCKISNCFQGHSLKHGASLSFWVKYFSRDAAVKDCGLVTFLGDHNRHYFDAQGAASETEYIDYTTHLAVTSNLCVEYDEAFQNTYVRKRNGSYLTEGQNSDINRILWRSDKSWMHVIISFTDNGIERFINGMRITDDYTVQSGKRFGKNSRLSSKETEYRTPITDFLSAEDTALYLGLTLDDQLTGEDMLFDDITFWDEAVKTDEDAMKLFNEALTINLP